MKLQIDNLVYKYKEDCNDVSSLYTNTELTRNLVNDLTSLFSLNNVVASLPDEETIYVSHGSDGDDDVYCAFTDLSKAEKDCEECGTSLTGISLYRK